MACGGLGERVRPSFVRLHVDFWNGVVLQGHPLHKTLLSYLREEVIVHEFLIASRRGPSIDPLSNVGMFPGAVFANRIQPELAGFVDTEMHSLIARGCVAKWADVRG